MWIGGFMGAVYRRKKRSCPLCKPNKVGREPARSPKERQLLDAMDKEIDEIMMQKIREEDDE